MHMAIAPNILTRAARLRLAQQLGYLTSTTNETSLRDRYGRECGDAGRLIAHLIVSLTTGRASIRINSVALDGRELGPAGWNLIWWSLSEHAAHFSWKHTATIVDLYDIPGDVGPLIIRRLIDLELWTVPCEVQ
jgi:hypothetical protein